MFKKIDEILTLFLYMNYDDNRMSKSDWKTVPKRTTQPSFFVTTKCGGHHNNVSAHEGAREANRALHPLWKSFYEYAGVVTTLVGRKEERTT
jgi:hypothetical protein